MEIYPIWRTTFWETSEDRIIVRILKGAEEIYRATAVKYPDEDVLKINLNKPCQNHISSSIEQALSALSGSTAAHTQGYAEFELQSYDPTEEEWNTECQFAFFNDWSYENQPHTTQSEPVNGHIAPGQVVPFSVIVTGDTAETICYDEDFIGPYLEVSPLSLNFDSLGGTSAITVVSNTGWVAVGDIDVSPSAGTSGTTTVYVNCSENESLSERNYRIRIRASKNGASLTEYVEVTQEAAEPFITILSGGDVAFDMSAHTWDVEWKTNLPSVYYELTGGGQTVTGTTRADYLKIRLEAATAITEYELNLYDTSGGTLYATAHAEQSYKYFNFLVADYAAVNAATTAYTITWDTNYPEVIYEYNGVRTHTSDSAVTVNFAANTAETNNTLSLSVYNANGAFLGTIHWVQLSVYSGSYLTIKTTGSAKLTFRKSPGASDNNSISYSVDNGATWTQLSTTTTTGTLNPQDGKILLKSSGTVTGSKTKHSYISLDSNKAYEVEGNYMSLPYGDDFAMQTEFPSGWTGSARIMFEGNVTNAEHLILPAESVEGQYRSMFRDCTGLTKGPQVYATTLGNGSCGFMFSGCTSLTEAPDLSHVESFGEGSCEEMFRGCTGLTETPVINGSVTTDSFKNMFSGCTNINKITCYSTFEGDSRSFAAGWANGVAPSGTFLQAEGMEWLYGYDGNPWWTQSEVGYTGITGQYETQYTTLEILSGGTLYFRRIYNLDYADHIVDYAPIFFSLNEGRWQWAGTGDMGDPNGSSIVTETGVSALTVNAGDKILLKSYPSYRPRFSNSGGWTNYHYVPTFSGSTCEFNVYGNAMSLIYWDDFRDKTELNTSQAFAHLFEHTKAKSAENWILPACSYAPWTMFETFSYSELEEAPVIAALTAQTGGAFTEAFYNCPNIDFIESHLEYIPQDGLPRWLTGVSPTGTFRKVAGVRYPTNVQNGWSIPENWTVEDIT